MQNLFKFKYISLFILAFIALFVSLHQINYSADTLFPFRYASALLSGEPYALLVQSGPRFFPDVFYAIVSMIITDNKADQTKIVVLLNIVLLSICAFYFFLVLFKNRTLSIVLVSFVLILIPVFDINQFGHLKINLYASGIHGFAIPYQLLIYGLSLKFLDEKKLSNLSYCVYFLIGCISGVNDSLFLASTIMPVCLATAVIWLMNKNKIFDRNLIIFIFCNVGIVLVTLIANKVLNYLFDTIHFFSTSEHYFKTDFITWLQGGAQSFYNEFFDIKTTQGASYLVVVSLIISIVSLIKNGPQSSAKVMFVNIINITWLPIALLSMWAIDKSLVRYIPYVLLLSPAIILVNFHQVINRHINKFSLFLLLVIVIFAIYALNHPNRYKYKSNISPNQFNGLMGQLNQLRQSGTITENGLSEYWVAWSSTQEYGFHIPSINDTGVPYVFVSDALAYWGKNNGNLEKLKYTFVVNRFIKGSKSWILNEEKLIENYGQFDESIPYQDEYRRKYLIYIYNDGINSDNLYHGAQYVRTLYFEQNQ